MATTRIISMHAKQGRTIAQCLTDRKDYAIASGKTEDGKYISAYACDPHTADAEFLLSKRQYEQFTGRTQYSNVIAGAAILQAGRDYAGGGQPGGL